MNPRVFLNFAFVAVLILSFMNLILPGNIAGIYSKNMMLLALFAAFFLSIKVAFCYERELRKVFLYLAPFILILILVNIQQFWDIIYDKFGKYSYINLIIAGIAYILLIMSCRNILKITDLREMDKREWVAIILMFIIGNYITIFFLLNDQLGFVDSLIRILFRIFDNAVVLMLLPVIFIYRKQSKKENRESFTFSIILIGIIISTIGDYVYEIFTRISHLNLMDEFHKGTFLDSIYILSYLLIALGLFVHFNYYKWTMNQIDITKLDFKFD